MMPQEGFRCSEGELPDHRISRAVHAFTNPESTRCPANLAAGAFGSIRSLGEYKLIVNIFHGT